MEVSLSPMLKQYHAVKSKHKDCILFFRLGDFYEMFYDDAKVASKILDLVLTSRGKDVASRIPMCGIPYHAADNYIAKLIKAGQKIAICEQLEDPALAKGIVKRDITRIISSGTYIDEHSSQSRFLLCVNANDKFTGIAFIDPTTGTIQANQYTSEKTNLVELIARLPIYECLFPQTHTDKMKELFKHPLLRLKNISLTPLENWSS